jgi:sirohydrochlorin ferrochelatase
MEVWNHSNQRYDMGMNLPIADTSTGIIIVDHGSRREESNEMLLHVVETYRHQTSWQNVEPAHMELAEPTIATAFDRCVAKGARRVVVMPYFLLPGKHWHEDIPALTAAAAAKHPGVTYLVTAPLGLSAKIHEIIDCRIDECLNCVEGQIPECELCAGSGRCLNWQEGHA